ncbi:MAG: hypothetical protein RR740_00660 [Pseudomonas sp.]
MPVQVVYTAQFQGDEFKVYRWHAKHYQWGQIADTGECIAGNFATSFCQALDQINDQMKSWAKDIDDGLAVAGGDYLDADGHKCDANGKRL